MSLHPHAIDPVSEETARIARAACPKGHIYLQLRDEFGTIYEDKDFLLGLEVDDPGFDASVLVEFRQRLLTSKEECLLFDVLLTRVT